MAYQSTGLASGGLGVARQQFVNGQPVSYYVDPNPATLVVPQIIPRPVALPPLVARNNLGANDPYYTSLSFNGPPEEIGAWANAYANATANSAPIRSMEAPQAPDTFGAAMAQGQTLAPDPRREAALQIVTNPPQIGITQPSLPPAVPVAPAPPAMPGQPATAPPAALPDDQPGIEVETFHDAETGDDTTQEGIGGGDGAPAVVPGAIPQAPAGGPPPPPPPPPSGWHPGMRTVDAQHTPAMMPTPIVDQIAALSESAINNPTITSAPSGFPSAAGVVPSVPAGATAATSAMLQAVLEINTDQQVPAMGDTPPGSTLDLSVPAQAALGIPPPAPPPPPMGGVRNKGKGKAHPIPDQFVQNLAAENAAFSGSAATGRGAAQDELLAAVKNGGGLKPAGERRRSSKPYARPTPMTEKEKAIAAREDMLAGIKGGVKLKPSQTRVAGPTEQRVETEYGWKMLKGDQRGPPTGIAGAMDAELRRRRAAIDPDNEDEQGDQRMDEADEEDWPTASPEEATMEDGMGVGMDPNARADMINIGAAAALAGRARRSVGSPFGSVPNFGSDEAFMAGKYDQTVPDDGGPSSQPSPPTQRRPPPGGVMPGYGNSKSEKAGKKKPSPKRTNKPKAKNPPKAGPP